MPSVPQEARRSSQNSTSALVRSTLARDRLSLVEVVCFCQAAATPLTVVSAVVVTGLAVTGLLGISLAFVVVACVLGLFAFGFVAMAQKISNAGAFYAFIAVGLSRKLGVGAAWLALLAYNALQVGLYGIVGAAAAPLAEQFLGVTMPWWGFALIAWAVTLVMGLREVTFSGRVLAVLLIAEVTVILVFSLAFVADPSPEGLSFATFAPGNLVGDGLGALLVMGFLAFVGFESSAVYAEESRNSIRTVRSATFVGLGISMVLYGFASWATSVATGPSHLVAQARSQQTELFFTLAADRLGPAADDVAHVLFVTSVLAALVSFHNTAARYAFALGREHVLPRVLGRTSSLTHAPVAASLLQSALGLVVIVVFAVAGLDPVVELFFTFGTAGGIGVLALLALTSVAVVSFFIRNPGHGVGVFSAVLAPMLSTIVLFVMLELALRNVDVLLGVRAGHPLTWIIPVVIGATVVAGAGWGKVLQLTRPEVFGVIGLGADSAAGRTVSLRADGAA